MRELRIILSTTLLLCWAASGCQTLKTQSALPVTHSVVRGQLVIQSDFGLPKQHRLLDELISQRSVLSEKLALPTTDEPIYVYLFGSADSFGKFIRSQHPDFPTRRAFFIESDTELAVYAHWGDRIAEDLRHEVAHGYLHAAVANLPLWLDEGLAEYFEVPRGRKGLNLPHVVQLRREIEENAWRPNLRRLESLVSVSDMTQLDYAESWAWVQMLLETTPDRLALLQGYLLALRQEATAAPLSLTLRAQMPSPDEQLLEYLAGLR